ncbi:MAG: hypothetical protein ACOY3N_23150 [Bradyrhizobium sp.]|uniref:hypothetical protein n=1 Tax=Bradyrhizobium sp. TaxID=376 RepID=UPI003BEF82D9
MSKYRGKHPTRIRTIWSAGKIGRFARTNDGVMYWINPAIAGGRDGNMPRLGDDATEHPACVLHNAEPVRTEAPPAPGITGASRDLVQHAIFLADNARRDLGLRAGDGASARPGVATLNRTLERLDSIIVTLAKALN